MLGVRMCSRMGLLVLVTLLLPMVWIITLLGGFWMHPGEISTEVQFYQPNEQGERIPNQLVMMHRYETVQELPQGVQENVRKMLEMNPDLSLRWLGDASCRTYIEEHYDAELVGMYRNEPEGSFRGDICRTAVLLKEGGFYVDTDIQLIRPLRRLVDSTTTFMSVWCDAGIFNAVLGAPPQSAVLRETLSQIRRWYKEAKDALGTRDRRGIMGPRAYHLGLQAVVEAQCPQQIYKMWYHGEPSSSTWGMSVDYFRATGRIRHLFSSSVYAAERAELQWACGTEAVRLYSEEHIICDGMGAASEECPTERAASFAKTKFDGLLSAMFEPHVDPQERRLIGWSRAVTCKTFGCGLARTPPPG